uniref:Uncharacterized protein n=1 Tax=Candidatus Kentrum sp. LPFa TaxID=2126335 RepID=A0A450VM88_9GAMM|nr:MAG: hypothetical protein BECKLPF1236B_GA0070989_100113 [Candidatus Kentron sp. LPFa]
MKQQPRFGAVGWISEARASSISSFPVDARNDPPYAGTFFICWGDETLNMIVKVPSMALDPGFHAGMTGSLNFGLVSKSERQKYPIHAFVGLKRRERSRDIQEGCRRAQTGAPENTMRRNYFINTDQNQSTRTRRTQIQTLRDRKIFIFQRIATEPKQDRPLRERRFFRIFIFPMHGKNDIGHIGNKEATLIP